MTEDKSLAARFFFRNCAVSLHLPGEMRISRTLTPGPDDVVLDRDFTPADSASEFIGPQSDFYHFLDITSPANATIIKKLAAIGYMLCNKLPRGGHRCRAFICVNEEKGACANGKTLFAKAVAQLCNTVSLFKPDLSDSFALSVVSEKTNLLVIDDCPPHGHSVQRLFNLCTSDWIIDRMCREPLSIAIENAPYVLVTLGEPVNKLRQDGSFRRRFVTLEFSSFFDSDNTIRSFIGRTMFLDWDKSQWHMFDNFMFHCVIEYLHCYSRGEDVFDFYA